jgi:hypothetical protein
MALDVDRIALALLRTASTPAVATEHVVGGWKKQSQPLRGEQCSEAKNQRVGATT